MTLEEFLSLQPTFILRLMKLGLYTLPWMEPLDRLYLATLIIEELRRR